MSAWSTNGRHNAILADALAVFGVIDPTPDAVEDAYRQLAEANERSLHSRYGDSLDAMAQARLPYKPGGEVETCDVVGLAESWKYQSDEADGYETEPAWILVTDLVDRIVASGQHTAGTPDGAWTVGQLGARNVAR